MASTSIPNSKPVSSSSGADVFGQSSSATISAPQSNRSRHFWATWVAGFTLVAVGLLWGKWQSPIQQGRSRLLTEASKQIVPLGKRHVQSPTKPIEEIRVGDRVLGENPTGEKDLSLGAEVDPATWLTLAMQAKKKDGSRCDIVLLRPRRWLEENEAKVGGTVPIMVPECGIEGRAEVLGISPCPPVGAGPGKVVTGTFRHSSAQILDLYADGQNEPIGTTGNHLFWSKDSGRFIRADSLRIGDRLVGIRGDMKVTRIEARNFSAQVYNLEIQFGHVYLVGESGILVHNSTPVPPGTPETVLIVGESETFEYAINFAKQNPNIKVTATTLGTTKPTGEIPSNLTIRTEINATSLKTSFPTETFDAVVFNAPRSMQGWKAESGELIDSVLNSATDVLKPQGEVRFSSTSGMPAGNRLNGYAKGGSANYPVPEGYQVPGKTPYTSNSTFGVKYTVRTNNGAALGNSTELEGFNWYVFRRTCPTP